MPAWITSLLRELAPVPNRSAASRINTSRPRNASSRATARPMTPAPTTTASTLSIGRECSRSRRARRVVQWREFVAFKERCVPVVNYRLDGEVAVLTITSPPVNALSLNVREGLMQGLQRAAQDPAVTALVVSGSGSMFSGGADITEIASGAALTAPMIADVQAQIEASDKPIVAAITGMALGGGFELALTCHARTMAPGAKVGLPEVKLGLIPGAGGTVRFTRLAGPVAALEAITSGAQIPAARAHELGLVDELAEDALTAAVSLAHRLAVGKQPLRIASELQERIREVNPAVFAEARKKLETKARGQLAPF